MVVFTWKSEKKSIVIIAFYFKFAAILTGNFS